VNVVWYGERIAVILEPREADRVNTIMLRHAVGDTVDAGDTANNRKLAGEVSNAIERLRPRPIEGATPDGDAP
jgi:hypothetical protein